MLAFGTGFVQVLSSDAGTFYGVIVGVCLAVAWTMALCCGSSSWKNGFNLFWALFTALSLGYLMLRRVVVL
jgi:hypothetical protein